jgi:sialate O-acetylesterase
VLPKILGNGMVLQRNQPVPIWGKASAGENNSVKFKDQTKTANCRYRRQLAGKA